MKCYLSMLVVLVSAVVFQNTALVHNKCLTWPCPFWESICNLGSVYVYKKGVGTGH